MSDRGLIELLEDYSSCEKALNELQRLDKQKQEYTCNCNNIRLEWKCSHIKSIIAYKENKNVKNVL